MEFQELIEEFLKHKKTYDDISQYTFINYKNDLTIFFEFTEGKYETTPQVAMRFFNKFVEYLLNEKKDSRTTINRRLSALKSFYKWLYNQEYLDYDLRDKIKLVKKDPDKIKNVLPQDKIFKILDKINDVRDRALLETLYSTGIREGELSALNIENVDFENKLVVIINGKGKKSRVVPISNTALKYIKASIGARKDGPLFLNNKGKRLGERGIYNVVKGYFDVSPHQLRHAFSTHMIVKTGNIKAVSEMLGHSNIQVTEKAYTHLNTDHLSEIHKLGGMDR